LGAAPTYDDFSDLYYRLNVIEVKVPPLRSRSEDIPALCRNMLDGIARRNGLEHAPLLTEPALTQLKDYPFHGNVRELENILERALTLCEDGRIGALDLQLEQTPAAATPDVYANAGGPLSAHLDEVEKSRIQAALENTRYNKTAAAKELGISFRALRYRLKKLGIE
jgi:two-component system response regulator PilR (NtrC family)